MRRLANTLDRRRSRSKDSAGEAPSLPLKTTAPQTSSATRVGDSAPSRHQRSHSLSAPLRESPLPIAKLRSSQVLTSSRNGDTVASQSPRSQVSSHSLRRSASPNLGVRILQAQTPSGAQGVRTPQRQTSPGAQNAKTLERQVSRGTKNSASLQSQQSQSQQSQSLKFDSFGVLSYTVSPQGTPKPASAKSLQRRESRPVSVDSPGSSQDSTPPNSPISQQSSHVSYVFSDVSSVQGSRTSSIAGSPRSLSSIRAAQNARDEITILRSQLLQAQKVVKGILQVDDVDKEACDNATKKVALMRFEIRELRDGYRTVRVEHEKLERRLEEVQGETFNEQNISRPNESLEEELEATVESMKEMLDQRDSELKNLREQLEAKRTSSNEQESVEQIQRLQKDLIEAKAEVLELERDRDINVAEISSLAMQLRNTPRQQSAAASADYQDLEEARYQVQKLEREREEQTSKEKELLRRLNETKAELARFKDCDSGLDYVDRVGVLEKRLADMQVNTNKGLASKDIEIKKLNVLIEDHRDQSRRWEIAASESSAQIVKMANHVEEMQTYLAGLEIENNLMSEALEEGENRIAKLEDQHWLRDQKLAGMKTLYDRSTRMLKDMENENDAIRSSFSTLDASSISPALSNEDVRPVENEGLKKKNKVLRKKVQELKDELERSATRVDKMSKDLQEYKARDSNNRTKIQKLEGEKKWIQNELVDMEARFLVTQKKRNSDASLALGLGAKEVATNTRILKMEQDKKSLEAQVLELTEKLQLLNERSDGDGWDPFNIGSDSLMTGNNLEDELMAAKREIVDSQHALESEQTARTADVNRLSKCLEESQAKVSALENRFARFLGSRNLHDNSDDMLELIEVDGNGESTFTVTELQAMIVAKNNDIKIWEEKHTMQVDQVDGLRDRLTEALARLEELEYERNFNEVKVMELTNMNSTLMQSDDEELHRLLTDKAVQCADLASKLTRAKEESATQQKRIDNLQMECALNKAKVAELSAIWDSQAEDDRAKKAVIMKAMEVAEQLNEALLRIEQLEVENEESSAKATALGVKLSNSVQIVDDLAKKLEAALREKAELEVKLMTTGITVSEPENKQHNRRTMFSLANFVGSEQIKASEGVDIRHQSPYFANISKAVTPRNPTELLSGQL